MSTARLLLRRWQAVALIIGLASAANTSVFGNVELLAHPMLALLAPNHGIFWRLAHLLATQAVAALWAVMQRAQIQGGAFMAFAGSLPFTPRQRYHVDLAVLLLADSPLMLVIGGAVAVAAAHRSSPAHAFLLCDVGLLALLTQLALLDRRFAGWAAAVVGCIVLAAGFGTRSGLAGTLLVGAAAVLALALGPWRMPRRGPHLRIPTPLNPVRRLLPKIAGRHSAALQVSLAILYREHRQQLIGKALAAAGVVAVAVGMMNLFDHDARSFPTILVAEGLVALTVSDLFRDLHMSHCRSGDYTGALPLARRWWRAFDLAVVLALALPFLAVLAAEAWIAGAPRLTPIMTAVVSYPILLCALRGAQLYSERHAVVLSVMLTAAWIAGMIAWLE